MLMRMVCLALLLLGGPDTSRAKTASCCSSSACCEGEHPRCPLLPNGTCSMNPVDQRVAIAAAPIGQLPPLAIQSFEPAEITAPAIRKCFVAAPAHPPPLFLLLHSFRN